MKALILAGGKGTRLRPLTVYTPKPVVPVLNRPFLLYQIEILRKAGITDITLSLSYQPGKIEDILGDGSDFGVDLTYVTEPSPMGTGGAYRFAADDSRETTIVFNGDILTDVDISEIVALHRSSKAEATLTLAPVPDPSAFGLVKTGERGEVLEFLEKPTPDQLTELTVNTINAGIYILEPSILDMIPKGENRSFEYNIFPQILEEKRPFFAYTLSDRYWRDIGTPQNYLAAHLDFLHGRIDGFELPASDRSETATAAAVDKNSVLGEGCLIKPHARITNSVLGPGVQVDEKAVIADSVIWAHTRVGMSAEVDGALIGRSCYIGRNSTVRSGTVLGDKASVPDYSKV